MRILIISLFIALAKSLIKERQVKLIFQECFDEEMVDETIRRDHFLKKQITLNKLPLYMSDFRILRTT